MRIKSVTREILESLDEDTIFFGAEGDEGEDQGADSGEPKDSDNDGDDENDDGDDDGSRDADNDDKTAGLKKALAEERAARRKLEKEKKAEERLRQRKEQGDSAALKQAQEDLEVAQRKAEKLAEGFRKTALDRAIEKAAQTLKFRDSDDALAMVDRSLIDVDQDEDDPADVKIDEDTVKRAVKALADKKKHLLQTGTEDGEPTGSQFGNRNNGRKKSTEADYKTKYSAL